ncbi:MAG TPA: 30S ribosomal protein S8 [Candidatus Diapherotrites archaeon]|jgi:small subunit ribosomal protein S8|nr:30S ribosomal protein S8 [Candidatus Diapherotrites archaeon]
MSLNDPIANALNNINNAEMASKQTCTLNHSKFLESVLTLLKKEGYIKMYKVLDKKPSKQVVVYLGGRINKCKAVKPRYPVKKQDYEKFEKSYLISRDVGVLIVSTTQGIMSHKDAKEKSLGGRIIGYIY